MSDIRERLRRLCNGHPYAKVPWPHRELHEAVDIIDKLVEALENCHAGYTALAPDLYHGEMAEHTEMDKAGALMTSLPPERAAKDMLGAIDALLSHDACSSDSVGVIGFCMGGMLTLRLCALAGDKVSVAAPPSIAASRFSSTSLVGFMIRV